jgi:aspartate kinase
VRDVRPDRVLTATEAGIAVVAGFQGVSDQGDVTTLGRGGSDATAVVLAHALAADRCEIYTDVDGVYAADPRVVPHANRLARLSHHNMLRMADAGARIVQPHAARLARDLRVPLHVRSTFSDREGTVIDAAAGAVPTDVILGIAHVRQAAPDRLPKLGRITILGAGASMGPAPHSLALAALRSGGLRVWATQVDAGGGVHVWTTRGDADKLVIFVDQAETDDAVRLLYDTLVAAPERESNVTFMP